MEAAVQAADKTILLRARADKGMLMLRVENALARPPKEKDGKFLTTKTGRQNHGLGLAGMEEITRRYGGSLEVSLVNDRFELVVCLPL